MTLFFGLLFGAVGSGYLVYAKRQHDALFLVVGFVLILIPYFIANAVLLIVVGLCLAAVPILHARGW
jgi:hypothetical protein